MADASCASQEKKARVMELFEVCKSGQETSMCAQSGSFTVGGVALQVMLEAGNGTTMGPTCIDLPEDTCRRIYDNMKAGVLVAELQYANMVYVYDLVSMTQTNKTTATQRIMRAVKVLK